MEIQVFWDMTLCWLVDTDVSEELASTIFRVWQCLTLHTWHHITDNLSPHCSAYWKIDIQAHFLFTKETPISDKFHVFISIMQLCQWTVLCLWVFWLTFFRGFDDNILYGNIICCYLKFSNTKKIHWMNRLFYVSLSVRIMGMRNLFKLFWILGRKKIVVGHMELKHKNCIIVYEK